VDPPGVGSCPDLYKARQTYRKNRISRPPDPGGVGPAHPVPQLQHRPPAWGNHLIRRERETWRPAFRAFLTAPNKKLNDSQDLHYSIAAASVHKSPQPDIIHQSQHQKRR